MNVYEDLLDNELRPLLDKRLDEREARGEERGKERGKALATADAVLRVVRHRFGTPAPAFEARIRRLDLATLEALHDALLDLSPDGDVDALLPPE